MEINLLETVGSYGIIGGAFLFMIWQNSKREAEFMNFIREQTKEMSIITSTLQGLADDVKDLRRKMDMQKGEE